VETDTSSSEDEMDDITFRGQPAQLEPLLTHCTVVFLAKASKFRDPSSKSGYIAARFRGPALEWLTSKLGDDKNLLDNYDEFVKNVKRAFLPSPEVQRQTAEQDLRKLRQRGSAAQYTLAFETLMNVLKYDTKAKCAAFVTGLKTEVKKQLVGTDMEDWDELRKSAIDYDQSLFALRNNTGRRKGQRTGPSDKRPN
jgi:hypothetical protein